MISSDAYGFGGRGRPVDEISDIELGGMGVFAAPWRLADLPGDDSMTWRERYELWRELRYDEWARRRLAEWEAPRGGAGEAGR